LRREKIAIRPLFFRKEEKRATPGEKHLKKQKKGTFCEGRGGKRFSAMKRTPHHIADGSLIKTGQENKKKRLKRCY